MPDPTTNGARADTAAPARRGARAARVGALRERVRGLTAVPPWAPEPPVEPPPGYLVHVPGRGEFFVRDTGGDGPSVLLLHGWMASADLNWWPTFAPLADVGFRVLAMDHRGHGRGLRAHAPFRLADCAADAAAVLDRLAAGPTFAVGYSMGGPITQLLARDHPKSVKGFVLCATSREWSDPRTKRVWYGMTALRVALGLAPRLGWRAGLRAQGFPDNAITSWVAAELSRADTRDVAEAGRELGRFDSRPWVGSLEQPSAVVVASKDRLVPPRKQRELARALGAPTFEVRGDHVAVVTDREAFAEALLRALEAVGAVRDRGGETARR